MNVYVCVRTCIHLYLRKFGDLRMCICICICIRVSTHLYDNVRLCTFIYAYLRVSTHLYVYLRICMCICACEHISTHVHVYQFSSIRDAYALHLTCLSTIKYLGQKSPIVMSSVYQPKLVDKTNAFVSCLE